MHDVTLVYTEYNHRLEVWVLGKRAPNTTADRQQYTNTSKVCDDTMSMGFLLIGDKQSIHLSHFCYVNWSTAFYFASHDREYFCKNKCYTMLINTGWVCCVFC